MADREHESERYDALQALSEEISAFWDKRLGHIQWKQGLRGDTIRDFLDRAREFVWYCRGIEYSAAEKAANNDTDTQGERKKILEDVENAIGRTGAEYLFARYNCEIASIPDSCRAEISYYLDNFNKRIDELCKDELEKSLAYMKRVVRFAEKFYFPERNDGPEGARGK